MRKGLPAIVVAILLLVTACGSGASAGSAKKRYRIGVVVASLSIKALADLAQGTQDRGKQVGADVTVFGSNDVNEQVNHVQNFITQHVDALIINPIESQPLVPVLKQAASANIPVILVVTDVPGGARKGVIRADEEQGGEEVASYIAQNLHDSGQVALVTGTAGNQANTLRLQGFHKVLKDHPGVQDVAEISASWSRPDALRATNDILTAHPDVRELFALNDDMAFGVASAIASRGDSGKLGVIGYNGASDGLQAVWKNQFQATVMLRLYGVGERAVNEALEVLDGKSIPDTYQMKPVLIDKTTMQGVHAGTKTVDSDVKASIDAAIASA